MGSSHVGGGTRGVLVNIQALRALAALLVVLFHLSTLTAAFGVTERELAFAANGVDLFFVVSGFIMVYTTDRAPTTPAAFLKNRVARVVPLYWAITLLVFGLALVAPSLFQRTDADVADLVRSLFFIPFERPDGTMRPTLFVGWSLNYEMFFYLVFAAALGLGGRRGMLPIAVAAIVALVIGGAWAGVSERSIAGFYSSPKMLEFAAGMAIARLEPHLPPSRRAAVIAIVVGLAVLVVAPLLLGGGASTLAALIACSLILVGALCTERAGIVARSPLVTRLGDASYSLYLTHPFVTQAVVKLWALSGRNPLAAVVGVGVAIAAACVLALLTWRWVELPLSRAARRLLGTRRPAVPVGGL